ncbi:hypothetical protein AACH06_26855 [Ideonella sp. DXS29W]|uniref:Uncharacterized protein n=1 Tax=Ideonella lacteola TaxID=2984193 RepID=A0ABU9BWV6_9BURK
MLMLNDAHPMLQQLEWAVRNAVAELMLYTGADTLVIDMPHEEGRPAPMVLVGQPAELLTYLRSRRAQAMSGYVPPDAAPATQMAA